MNESPVLEVMPEQKELLVVIEQNALPADAAQSLTTSFAPAFKEAGAIIEQSRQIVVTSADQKLQIKLAREYRLALRAIRVGADKKRKELKDVSLRQGRAIDGFYNILLHLTDTEEQRLAAQEEFVERQEAARKQALKEERTKVALANGIDPMLYQLGEMSEETFQQLVEGTKLARAAKLESDRKAEAERIAREAEEAKERERIRLENERLKKEAAEKEAALKAEREKAAAEKAAAEAQARKEQAEREAADAEKARLAAEERKRVDAANAKHIAEMKAKMEAERIRLEQAAAQERKIAEDAAAKAKAEREQFEEAMRKERLAREKLESEARAQRLAEEAAARKAASAPDREKLLAFAAAIRAVEMPALTSEAALPLVATLVEQREKLAAWIERKAEAL